MIEYTRKPLSHFCGAAGWGCRRNRNDWRRSPAISTRKLKTFANWEMQAAVRSLRQLTSKDVRPVMETLEALGVGAPRRSGQDRSAAAWVVNPKVHDGRFAKQSEEEAKRRAEAGELIAKAVAEKKSSGRKMRNRRQVKTQFRHIIPDNPACVRKHIIIIARFLSIYSYTQAGLSGMLNLGF